MGKKGKLILTDPFLTTFYYVKKRNAILHKNRGKGLKILRILTWGWGMVVNNCQNHPYVINECPLTSFNQRSLMLEEFLYTRDYSCAVWNNIEIITHVLWGCFWDTAWRHGGAVCSVGGRHLSPDSRKHGGSIFAEQTEMHRTHVKLNMWLKAPKEPH